MKENTSKDQLSKAFEHALTNFSVKALRAELELIPDICRKLRERGEADKAKRLEAIAAIVRASL